MEEKEKKRKSAKKQADAFDYVVLFIMQEMVQKGELTKAAFRRMVNSYGSWIDRSEFSCYA